MRIPSETLWSHPVSAALDETREIHLWRATSLDKPADFLEPCLNRAEHERAEHFRFPVHRNRFIYFRATLRRILGRYMNQAPEEVEFAYAPGGKPLLVGETGGLEFNLSHSGDWMVLACGRTGPLGVDIEHLDRHLHCDDIARRYFTPAEAEKIGQTPEPEKRAVFFEAWTAREAVLKATGEGLRRLSSAHETTRAWSLVHFSPAADHAGCLATAAPYPMVRLFDFQDLTSDPEPDGAFGDTPLEFPGMFAD